jgi:hypothetical protein
VVKLTGGDRLQAKLNDLARRLGKGGKVRMGYLEGATTPDGVSIPMYAAANNFGAPAMGVPPRPFFTNMIAEKSEGWGDSLLGILKANSYDVGLSLDKLGEHMKGQLQDSINQTNAPPLSPKTIARKGFAKPLIDKGYMFNDIGVEVEE